MEMLYYFIRNISILGITIFTGASLATLFVSKFCWKYMDKEIKVAYGIHSLDSESESESEPENEEEKFYNDDKEFLKEYYYSFKYKFFEKFKDLKERNLSDDEKLALKSKIFEIDTPKGLVKIYYDFENLEFKYYAKRSLEFWMLQTISQGYALEYDCKEIIIDVEKSLIDLYKKDKEKQHDNNNNINSVFLPTKKSVEKDNPNEMVDLFKKYGHQVQANKFRYLGKLSNFEEEINRKEKEEFVNISYKDYLNLKKNQ